MNKCPKCGSTCLNKEFIRYGKLSKHVAADNMNEFIETVTLTPINGFNTPYTYYTVTHEHIRNTCNTCGYCILTHPLDYKGACNEQKTE